MLINAYRKKELNEYFYNEELAKEREEGIAKGIKENSHSIAMALKWMDMDNASISKATGLNIEEIEKL